MFFWRAVTLFEWPGRRVTAFIRIITYDMHTMLGVNIFELLQFVNTFKANKPKSQIVIRKSEILDLRLSHLFESVY